MVPDKAKGAYLGTEKNEKWWKRYIRDGLFARGNGEYWLDEKGLYFRRYLIKRPIFIAFSDILEIKLGKSHAGRWCMGNTVMKIVWKKEGLRLSSGFLILQYKEAAKNLKDKIDLILKKG